MKRKISILMALIILSSFECKTLASIFPTFRCFTDIENDLLIGRVEKIIMSVDDEDLYEMRFNKQGNYTSIVSLKGYSSTIRPFHRRNNRYSCEGLFVNNYYNYFFTVGVRDEDAHIPFWLHLMDGGDKWSFSYDGKGNLVSVTIGKYDGDEYGYIYDEKGRLVTRTCNDVPQMKLRWSGNDIIGYYIYNKYGDEHEGYDLTINGNRIEVNDKHALYKKSFMDTNNKGKIIYYERRESAEQKIQVHCDYNNNGLIEKMTEIYTANQFKNTTTTTFRYDVHENLLESEMIKKNISGLVMQQEHLIYVYTYDNVGNWISRITYTIKKGDIEVKKKVRKETRKITYYDD